MRSHLAIPTLILALTAGVAAQTVTHRWIPAGAYVGGQFSYDSYIPAPFTYGNTRVQQIIAGHLVAKNSSLIQEMALLPVASGFGSGTVYGDTIKSVKISLGTTPVKPGKMVVEYAKNRGTANQVVFQGNLVLPNLTGGLPGQNGAVPIKFTKPYVFVGGKGNLLLEIENPTTYRPLDNYEFACTYSGTGRGYNWKGLGGKLPPHNIMGAPDRLEASAGGTTLTPGTDFKFRVHFLPAKSPTLGMLGFRIDQALGGIQLPLDLTGLGAPGNHLYIDPRFILPFALYDQHANFPRIGAWWKGEIKFNLPNTPAVAGSFLFCQAVTVIPGVNTAGILTSNWCGGWIGSGVGNPTVEALVGDTTQSSGSMWVNGGRPPAMGKSYYGGLCVRFGGTFN